MFSLTFTFIFGLRFINHNLNVTKTVEYDNITYLEIFFAKFFQCKKSVAKVAMGYIQVIEISVYFDLQ